MRKKKPKTKPSKVVIARPMLAGKYYLPIDMDLRPPIASSQLVKAFKKAAMSAAWLPSQMSEVLTILRDCDTVESMIGILSNYTKN